MGNADTKPSYRQAVLDLLASRSEAIEPDDEEFWSQFWHNNHIESIVDVFTLISAQEIRQLRDECPSNLSTLCYKAVEQLVHVTDTLCNTTSQQKTVLTCSSLLIRLIPYLFEDCDWRRYFWSQFAWNSDNDCIILHRKKHIKTGEWPISNEQHHQQRIPLAHSLLLALADLLFCPDFTVAPLDSKGNKFGAPDTPPDDLQSIDSCEYIWEAGVGCSISSPSSANYDLHRTQILRLILTCFSESMYCSAQHVGHQPNKWIEFFTSNNNRHALPLFTSLLNTVFSYNPNSFLPFNHLLFYDSKEPLVQVSLQLLIVILDHDFPSNLNPPHQSSQQQQHKKFSGSTDNLFINYISRIHREDDFEFILKGFTRLLNNPLQQSYLPNSTKKIQFHQELLVLFWKICDYNKKFMYYVLKTCDVLKILVPILYHLNDARADRSRVGLVHIGVFIILLLSGERNFGVRLNRPYLASASMDLPIFSGTHADLLVIVFHKLITTGHQRLQPLFDCLLTILVNVSPYLKTLSMVAAVKILHLLEAFSTPWFLLTNPTNHHLVFFLLEIFNNIIQYQFDGNSNLIYTIIRKRHVFHALTNLPTDYGSLEISLNQAKLQIKSINSIISTNTNNTSEIVTNKKYGKHWEQTRPKSLIETSRNEFGIIASSNPSTPNDTHNSFVNFNVEPNESIEHVRSSLPDHLAKDEGKTMATNTVNISLAAMPILEKMTERTHPNPKLIDANFVMNDKDEDDNNYYTSIDNDQITNSSELIAMNKCNASSISRQSSAASDDHSSVTSSARAKTPLQNTNTWHPTTEWIMSWKQKLPLQTIMRMLQVWRVKC